MTVGKNRQILLASRPHGEPKPANFTLVEKEVPEPGPGQMVLHQWETKRLRTGYTQPPPIDCGATATSDRRLRSAAFGKVTRFPLD